MFSEESTSVSGFPCREPALPALSPVSRCPPPSPPCLCPPSPPSALVTPLGTVPFRVVSPWSSPGLARGGHGTNQPKVPRPVQEGRRARTPPTRDGTRSPDAREGLAVAIVLTLPEFSCLLEFVEGGREGGGGHDACRELPLHRPLGAGDVGLSSPRRGGNRSSEVSATSRRRDTRLVSTHRAPGAQGRGV